MCYSGIRPLTFNSGRNNVTIKKTSNLAEELDKKLLFSKEEGFRKE